MAERKLTFRVGADVQEATTSMDRLTAKLQAVSVQTTGTGDKFTQLDRNAETLAKRLGVELSGSTNKSVAAFQALYDYLVKVKAPTQDIDAAFNALTAAQAKYQGGTSFWKEHSGMITAAGSAALAFGVSAVKAFSESEQAGAQLDAVLRSTAGAAGVTRDEAEKLAASLSKMSGIDDEAILGAETMILRFTNIGKDIFPAATKAVLDLSVAMGTDLQSAALMVGKALDSPGQGMTALQRATGKFTEEEVKSITAMAEHGKMAEAQAAILDKLSEKFGGAAAAAGATFAGSLNKAQVESENFMESVGSKIVPMLQGLIDTFPTASTAVIGFGGAVGNLNISTGDLLIALPLLKTAFGATFATLAAGAATISLITAGLTALIATVWAFVAATKAQHEEVKANYDAMKLAEKATAELEGKLKQYGLTVERGKKDQYEYNAEMFKAIANYERTNNLLPKVETSHKALNTEVKKGKEHVHDLMAAQMKFAEVTQKDAVDAIKKEMEAFKDLDKAMLSHGGLQNEIMQRNAKLIGQFETELPDALKSVPPLVQDIDAAYKNLGITSTESLQKQAEEAQLAYETIADSGTASARDIDLAFAEMVRSQIEAAKAMGKEVPAEFEAMADKIEAKWGTAKDNVNKHSQGIGDFWSKQVSTIVTDFSKGVTDIIFGAKSLKDGMISIFEEIGKALVRSIIEQALNPIMKKISDVLGGLIKIGNTGGTVGGGGGGGGGTGGGGGAGTWGSTLLSAGLGLAIGGAIALFTKIFGKDQNKIDDTKVVKEGWPQVWATYDAYVKSGVESAMSEGANREAVLSAGVGLWNDMVKLFKRPESAESQRTYILQFIDAVNKVYSNRMSTHFPGEKLVDRSQLPVTPLAEGGIVTRPTVALIGERGPEAVIPLSKSGAGIVIQSMTVVANDPEKFADGLMKLIETNRGGIKNRMKLAFT